jgi:hypothetical protein
LKGIEVFSRPMNSDTLLLQAIRLAYRISCFHILFILTLYTCKQSQKQVIQVYTLLTCNCLVVLGLVLSRRYHTNIWTIWLGWFRSSSFFYCTSVLTSHQYMLYQCACTNESTVNTIFTPILLALSILSVSFYISR